VQDMRNLSVSEKTIVLLVLLLLVNGSLYDLDIKKADNNVDQRTGV
jgi:predicted RND superfamily exporter protein